MERSPLGMGLSGLLAMSSATDSGNRWLARSKMMRFVQFQRKDLKTRIRMIDGEGTSCWWHSLLTSNRGEKDTQRPNKVFGNTKVPMSLFVIAQRMTVAFLKEEPSDIYLIDLQSAQNRLETWFLLFPITLTTYTFLIHGSAVEWKHRWYAVSSTTGQFRADNLFLLL